MEPGPNMAAFLRRLVTGRPCHIVESRFEDAALEGPFDVAVAGTSFHWVDPAVGVEKLAGLLGRGGWLALFWNVHGGVDGVDDEWTAAMSPIAQRVGNDHSAGAAPPLDADARTAEIEAGGRFELVDRVILRWPHAHDSVSMRALFASFSSWSTLAEPERTRALDDIAALVDERFGGSVTRTYTSVLYVARRL